MVQVFFVRRVWARKLLILDRNPTNQLTTISKSNLTSNSKQKKSYSYRDLYRARLGTVRVYNSLFCFNDFFELVEEITVYINLARAVCAVSAVTDSFLSCSVAYLLLQSRSGFARSDSAIHRIVVYAISTGIITGVCEVASLVTAFSLPGTFVYIAFFLALPKCKHPTSINTSNKVIGPTAC